MSNERAYECPLCGTDFTGALCHSSCPMSSGCAMVRCPHCSYEFVESGRFVDMLLRWIRRAPATAKAVAPDRSVMSVAEMQIGASAPVAFITPSSAARMSRLASFGIVAGTEVRLVSRRPTVVLACGTSTVAIEDDVAREVYVRTMVHP
jgi:Fe2+ transport system protein FeoA